MLLLFLIVAQHESGTRKLYLGQWSIIKKNYPVSATAQIEQVQDKKNINGTANKYFRLLKHLIFQSFDYPHYICINLKFKNVVWQ